MNAPRGADPFVSLKAVSKVFDSGSRPTFAAREISFRAFPGELVLLLGPSGSGKTTLLTMIAGLSRPSSGRIELFGKELGSYGAKELQRVRARRIGFIFQTFLLLDSLTVRENVELVGRFTGLRRVDRKGRAAALLRDMGIEHLAEKFPPVLSQGEKQRVAVARAVANEADLIIADEPTGSLETRQGQAIIGLLEAYAKRGAKTVIVASHDLRLQGCADRVLRLEDGRLAAAEARAA